MPAGDASLKTAQLIKMLVDSNHGIYRDQSVARKSLILEPWKVALCKPLPPAGANA
jgi:hypothetical protein